MNPRDRILAAIHHEEPDTIPTALWGSYYTLNDDTYFAVLDYLGLGKPVAPFRRFLSRNSNYYDDRVLDALGTDVRYLWSGFTDSGGANMKGDRTDCWGVEWERRGHSLTSRRFPLEQAVEVGEVEAHRWPDPERYIDRLMVGGRVEYLGRKYPYHATAARAVNSYGPFEQAAELRGREQFYVDMIADRELAAAILRKCSDVIIRGNEIYLDAIGDSVDFFELPGDDYGATEALVISPGMFRELVKPELARIITAVKDQRPNLPVAFHTDGAITTIIPDLVDSGVDILNPLEPLPATDWAAVKEEYQGRLCFMGGVDVRQAMRGTIQDVEDDVTRCIETFAGGGGYILTPANHLQADVPPENIAAMYSSARGHGEKV